MSSFLQSFFHVGFFPAFSVLNYTVSYFELISTLTGLLAVFLNARGKIINWFLGIISVVTAAILFYNAQLYADLFLQIYFVVTNIYGWYLWRKNRIENIVLDVVYLTKIERRNWLMGISVAYLVLILFISNVHILLPHYFPMPAAYPIVDSFIWVVSMAGNALSAKKKIESWYLWILVDMLAPIVYYMKDLKFIGLEYLIFLVIAAYGLVEWRKMFKVNPLNKQLS